MRPCDTTADHRYRMLMLEARLQGSCRCLGLVYNVANSAGHPSEYASLHVCLTECTTACLSVRRLVCKNEGTSACPFCRLVCRFVSLSMCQPLSYLSVDLTFCRPVCRSACLSKYLLNFHSLHY